MSDTFQWTKEGKTLLLAFQITIKKYGGNEKLADAIEVEWTKQWDTQKKWVDQKNKIDWTTDHINYLKMSYLKMGYSSQTKEYIAAKLGRSVSAIENRLNKLFASGELTRPRRKARRKLIQTI